MRIVTICILSLLLLTGLYSAGLSEEEPPLRILYVPGVADPFYYTLEQGARKKAEELGVILDTATFPSFWDAEDQILIMQTALAEREYDLLMISPVATDDLIQPLAEVHARGIKIITVDTKIGDGDYRVPSDWSFPLTHIGTDNFAGGLRLAEYIAEQVGERGPIYINTTTPDTSTTEERKEAFIEGIARFPEMEVVRIDYNGDLQEVAVAQTLAALQDFPDLVGVFGSNVFSSQGISEAVGQTGLSGAVRVAAWDATESLIEDLRNGRIDVVLAQKPAEMGALGVEYAYRALTEGREIPAKITSGYILFTPSNLNDPGMAQYVYSRK